MRRLCVEGERTYLGRSVACHGIVTEGGAIHSDRAAEVSSGRISRASDEGPNSRERQVGRRTRSSKEPTRRIAPKVLLRCKQKIRDLTRRTRGISLEQMLKELTAYLRGWKSYFGFCQTPSLLQQLDRWIRHRLRSMIWKQWKHGQQR